MSDCTVLDASAIFAFLQGEPGQEIVKLARALGLSLGDRLCLVAAQRLKAKILTADRPWLITATALSIDIV